MITGFGSSTECLVTVTVGAQYTLSVNVDGKRIGLWYDGISSPAIHLPGDSVSLRNKRQSKVDCKSLLDARGLPLAEIVHKILMICS